MAGIVLEHVTKIYPAGVTAVRDLCLSVNDGELLVLVGPSGCGKSTTLRLIAGLETLTAGTIRISGRPVNDLEPHRRNVAMVFQRPALYPHLNVRDNLAFGLRMGDGTEPLASAELVASRVAEAAQLLGLGDLLDRRPAQLSGGEQQRVALGRALVRRPGAFLLDEPLSSLDLPLRHELRRELHLLHRRSGSTIVYVTHDQAEALALGDRVAVLERGTLQQVAVPDVLYERPGNRFVARFIGWPPMNLLDGEVGTRDGRIGIGFGECWLPLPDDARCSPGRPVTLGLRPEQVMLNDASGAEPLVMAIELVERLGRQQLVTMRRDRIQLQALCDGLTPWGNRQAVRASWDMAKAHLFDGQTGVALGQGGPAG